MQFSKHTIALVAFVAAMGAASAEEIRLGSLRRGLKAKNQALRSLQGDSVCSEACAEEFLSGCMGYHCSENMTNDEAWTICREEINGGVGPLITQVGCAVGCRDTAEMAIARTCGCEDQCRVPPVQAAVPISPQLDMVVEKETAAPAKDNVEKDAAPAKDNMEKDAAPAKDNAAKDAAPAKDNAAKDAAPAKDNAAKDAAPAKDNAAKDAAPAKDNVEKDAAPAKDNVEKDAAPAKDNAAKDAAPAKDNVEKDAAPAKDNAAKDAAPAKDNVEKDAAPAKDNAEPRTLLLPRTTRPRTLLLRRTTWRQDAAPAKDNVEKAPASEAEKDNKEKNNNKDKNKNNENGAAFEGAEAFLANFPDFTNDPNPSHKIGGADGSSTYRGFTTTAPGGVYTNNGPGVAYANGAATNKGVPGAARCETDDECPTNFCCTGNTGCLPTSSTAAGYLCTSK